LFKYLNIEVDDGVNTRVCDKEDGMQRALMLAIMELYAEYRKSISNGENNLFFIDEAEIHLHPSAQRRLKNVLLELSGEGDQVFMNTHSSVFIADENERQNIYQVFKENKQTKCIMVKEQEKPNVVFELLGGNFADLLLPYNFLIVEGRTERTFLSNIIQRFYSDKPKIQIIEAQGDINKARRSFFAVTEMFKPLHRSMNGNRVILICDFCEDAQINSFVATYGAKENEQIFRLPEKSIEKYYPQPWKKNPRLMSGEDKVLLAKTVAVNITKEQFETKMSCYFHALTNCWDKAFKRELN
jgi:putative ATP-dependent endonuclease of OLD family